MSKYTCFVISPIGQEGTELFEEYNDLFNLIIIPSMRGMDIDVKRGDHFVTDDKIDSTIIREIQQADVCICDITEPNPNVYYELGRRDETGKPVILLKRKGSAQSPVDIANRRFIEYEWEGRHGIHDAQEKIRESVEPFLKGEASSSIKSASLADIADTLSRLERKIDRLKEGVGTAGSTGSRGSVRSMDPSTPEDVIKNPTEQFKYALVTRNIKLAEQCMPYLEQRMDTMKYYDMVVEQVASMGSNKAGQMLIEFAEEFMDSDLSFKKKMEYLGCLVGYSNRTDSEAKIYDLVNRLCRTLEGMTGSAKPEEIIQIYNQLNRLNYGMYGNTNDSEYLNRAIEALEKALSICEAGYLYYNLSTCCYAYYEDTEDSDYLVRALNAISHCLEKDEEKGEVDADHLHMACKVYKRMGDPRLDDTLERLDKVDHMRAFLFKAGK